MAETADPPRAPDPLPPPAPPGRWDWRPKLRWFAAEILIVVAGVLIALALNAWWQGRQDAQREGAYLSEINRDLIETETSLQDAFEGIGNTRYAMSSLIRAAYVSDTVPRDSLARWLFEAQYITIPTYRMGMASALIKTGDLQLISDDSTRIALSRLVDDVRRIQNIERILVDTIFLVLVRLRERTATTELYPDLALLAADSLRNGAAYVESHALTLPENGQLLFADDYADLLNDAASFRDWRAMSDHLLVLQTQHGRILDLVQQTRQQIENNLNP